MEDGEDGLQRDKGVVYVFTRTGTVWNEQPTLLRAPNGEGGATSQVPGDMFGWSVAFSVDGATLVVGAPLEDGSRTGTVDNDNDDAPDAGAVYIFVRNAATYELQTYLKPTPGALDTVIAGDRFGSSVALAAQGGTLVVGAPLAESGIRPSDFDDGAAYVFTREAASWTQRALLGGPHADANARDQFGRQVTMAAGGARVAVGAPFDDEGGAESGAAYVFATMDRVQWQREAYLKAPNAGAEDTFGFAVALSADALTLAIGAQGEDGDATSTLSDDNDNIEGAGAVYVYTHGDSGWSATPAYLKPSNTIESRRIRSPVVVDCTRQRAGSQRASRSKRAAARGRCVLLRARWNFLARAGEIRRNRGGVRQFDCADTRRFDADHRRGNRRDGANSRRSARALTTPLMAARFDNILRDHRSHAGGQDRQAGAARRGSLCQARSVQSARLGQGQAGAGRDRSGRAQRELQPGQTVIEASSGNTGIGLAMVCAQKGYPLVVMMAENFSVERRKLMRFLGAKVVLTPAAEKGSGMVAKAAELALTHGWFLCRQFENEANADFHSKTTAVEILEDFGGERLDYWVTGLGTGGTLKGVARVLKKERPQTKIVVCEPDNSALAAASPATRADGARRKPPAFRPHPMQGWTPDFIPKLAEDAVKAGLIDEILPIKGGDALRLARELAQKEGILPDLRRRHLGRRSAVCAGAERARRFCACCRTPASAI